MNPVTFKKVVAIILGEAGYWAFALSCLFWWLDLGLLDAAVGSGLISTLVAVLVLLILIGSWTVGFLVHSYLDD